ncbi:hypothetical protein FS749_012039 [Ceratobasidium sp. UAMH 11750]|nr:hypothetical protein FS749_012039 [Ceratobasidium sp. UAMH 11750]
MTAITHIDPDFSSMFAIEAINEPEMDYNKTPGLGDYDKNFVKVIRLVELALGVKCPDTDYSRLYKSTTTFDLGILAVAKQAEPAIAEVLKEAASYLPSMLAQLRLNVPLKRALGEDADDSDSGKLSAKYCARGISTTLNKGANCQCLTTTFTNKDWQYNNPVNPTEAAIRPQFYDAHLYFSFGGVADPNAESYLKVICSQ